MTGANYLLETKNARILVDCGLTQGSRYCEQQNFQPFPYDPKGIQAVFISHAHIDHIGRLPMLYKQGLAMLDDSKKRLWDILPFGKF